VSATHKTNLGDFGRALRCDLDGYTYTTQAEWMRANMDGMTWQGYTAAQKRAACREMAADARAALASATRAVATWQAGDTQ
jgi:hypothetical protein